jgi:hypothetical protein
MKLLFVFVLVFLLACSPTLADGLTFNWNFINSTTFTWTGSDNTSFGQFQVTTSEAPCPPFATQGCIDGVLSYMEIDCIHQCVDPTSYNSIFNGPIDGPGVYLPPPGVTVPWPATLTVTPTITTPEPSTGLLVFAAAIGARTFRRRGRR